MITSLQSATSARPPLSLIGPAAPHHVMPAGSLIERIPQSVLVASLGLLSMRESADARLVCRTFARVDFRTIQTINRVIDLAIRVGYVRYRQIGVFREEPVPDLRSVVLIGASHAKRLIVKSNGFNAFGAEDLMTIFKPGEEGKPIFPELQELDFEIPKLGSGSRSARLDEGIVDFLDKSDVNKEYCRNIIDLMIFNCPNIKKLSVSALINTEDLKNLLRGLRKNNKLLSLELDNDTCKALDAECIDILNDEGFALQEIHLEVYDFNCLIPKLTKLTSLRVPNVIGYGDLPGPVAFAFVDCPKLRKVSVSFMQMLSSFSQTIFSQILSSIPSLTELEMENFPISDETDPFRVDGLYEKLLITLPSVAKLQKLTLRCWRKTLAQMVKPSIDADIEKHAHIGSKTFFTSLTRCSHLTELNIIVESGHVMFNIEDLTEIARCPNLKELNLSLSIINHLPKQEDLDRLERLRPDLKVKASVSKKP